MYTNKLLYLLHIYTVVIQPVSPQMPETIKPHSIQPFLNLSRNLSCTCWWVADTNSTSSFQGLEAHEAAINWRRVFDADFRGLIFNVGGGGFLEVVL